MVWVLSFPFTLWYFFLFDFLFSKQWYSNLLFFKLLFNDPSTEFYKLSNISSNVSAMHIFVKQFRLFVKISCWNFNSTRFFLIKKFCLLLPDPCPKIYDEMCGVFCCCFFFWGGGGGGWGAAFRASLKRNVYLLLAYRKFFGRMAGSPSIGLYSQWSPSCRLFCFFGTSTHSFLFSQYRGERRLL